MKDRKTPIVILGSGRSGTTWIMDVLAEANQLQTVFEPFLKEAVMASEKFGDTYLREDEKVPELESLMSDILSGKLQNLWTKYRVRPDRLKLNRQNITTLHGLKHLKFYYKKLCRHLIKYRKNNNGRVAVKFIRANLISHWLSKHFDIEKIYVIRHPAAVVNSKMILGWDVRRENWDYRPILKRFREGQGLVNEYLEKYIDIFNAPLSEVEAYTLIWCVENILPMQIAQKSGDCIVFYEDLLSNPKKEWQRIIDALSLENMPQKESIIRPSMEASNKMRDGVFGVSQISRWMKTLSPEQLKGIQRVLDHFNFKVYNVFEATPANRILGAI